MTSQRNYVEELALRVEAGKRAGQSLSESRKSMPVGSMKTLACARAAMRRPCRQR
jgi:hypothetical protein